MKSNVLKTGANPPKKVKKPKKVSPPKQFAEGPGLSPKDSKEMMDRMKKMKK